MNVQQKESLFQIIGVLFITAYIYNYTLIPLQDYPDWIYQGFLLKQLLLHQINDALCVRHAFVPNSSATVVIGLMSFLMTPLYAGKLFLLLSTVVSFLGIGKFLTYHHIKNIETNYLAAFVLTFNFNYFHGNINFVLGMGMAFCLLVYFLKNRSFLLIYLIGNPLLYLTHFFPFLLFNAYLFLFLMYHKEVKSSLKILGYNIPLLLLFSHYFLTREIPDLSHINNIGDMVHSLTNKISIFLTGVQVFPIAKGIHEGDILKKIAVYANYGIGIGYSVMFVLFFLRHRVMQEKFHLYFILVLLFLYFLLPYNMAGIVRPSERLVLFMIVLIIIEYLRLGLYNHYFRALFFLLAILQFSYINYMTYDYNNKYAFIQTEQQGIGVHRVFMRKEYYKAMQTNDTSLDFFCTGILEKK